MQLKNVIDHDFNEMGVRVMVFNATFNNISVVWWSVLLQEEPVKTNDRLQVTDKLK
jgi:hypothetical protein